MTPTNINRLGVVLDGWSELIDGRGNQADNVRAYINEQLEVRQMPQVTTRPTSGYVNTKEAARPYLASTRYPGVTGAIYVVAHGEDLYVSWKTFQKRIPNWRNIGIMIGLSLLFGILDNADAWFTLLGRSILWVTWLLFFVAGIVLLPLGAWRLYQKIKTTATFEQQVNLTPVLDRALTVLSVIVGLLVMAILVSLISPPPRLFLPSISSLLRAAFWAFLAISIASFFLGTIRHGYPLAYFLAIPNLFDADDTLALSFSIHKTVVHALDRAGIDVSALHKKASTTRGRPNEEI